MKIDVVIPTFNRLWALKRIMPFYLLREEVERVIVIDDCSTDGTFEWLLNQSSFEPRISFVHHEHNRGASAARNTGAYISKSPLVFFADDDMQLSPKNGLQILMRELFKFNGDIIAPTLIFSEMQFKMGHSIKYLDNANILQLYHPLLLERKSLKKIKKIPAATFETGMLCGLMLVKREVLMKISYDEDLGATSYRDETDFQLKALGEGFCLLSCPHVVLVDFERKNDNGGCHSLGLIEQKLQSCHNNWRILTRHKRVIHYKLGIKSPIIIMQVMFFFEHFVKRLIRQLLGDFFREGKFLNRCLSKYIEFR